MSDVDGMDAYNRVLELLLEATERNQTLRDEKGIAQQAQRDARSASEAAGQRAQMIENDRVRNLPKFKELHEAAAAALVFVTSESPEAHEAKDRLRGALKDAADICGCDDIPF